MKLALPVQNPKAISRTLLNAGFELNDAAINRVKELGIRTLWVSYPGLAAVEKYISLETIKVQQDVVRDIADAFEQAQNKATAKLDYDHYTQTIQGMVDHVTSNPKTAIFIGELSDSGDHLMRHASTVTYLSVLMGMKLEGYMVRERKHVNPAKAKEIANLGVGAMLHDFGMTQLDEDTLERFELNGDETDPAYREHPALGFRAVRGQIDPSAATVLLHHHQNFDGSGFAGREFPPKAGSGIHVYARIVAVADQFDRLRRPMNLPEQPTVAVLSAMLSPALRKRFDPEVLRALIEVVPPYAPGTQLKLSDGRQVVSVDHNAMDPCRPIVQTIDLEAVDGDDHESETIDLSQEPATLYVAQCDGQPVGDFNFSANTARLAA